MSIILINRINEAFEYLREDLTYVSMVGLVESIDINHNKYIRHKIEHQRFDHEYEFSEIYDEDCSRGEVLIPLYGNTYMLFEFIT
jgi:hypothetical protein